MKHDVLFTRLVIASAAILLVGASVIPAVAQDQNSSAMFEQSTATITLTDSGLTITPENLNPGPVTYTVENQSAKARGVVVTGRDRANSPIVRYSARIMSGKSTTMNFWLYEGATYTFRDYTTRAIRGGKMAYDTTYSMHYTVPNPYPLGRGPQYEEKTGTITITNSGMEVSPTATSLGPIMFTITNETQKARGIFITGEDRANSPIFRYSKVVRPGQSVKMSFWLYEGKTYKVQDYTRRITARGAPAYSSALTSNIVVSASSPLGEVEN